MTKEDIISAYKGVLNREPSEYEIVYNIEKYKDFKDMFLDVVSSAEKEAQVIQTSTKQTPCIVLGKPGGIKLYADLNDQYIGLPALKGTYELSELQFCLTHLNEGDVILDIGANIGVFTLNMAKALKDGLVIAVEPLYENYNLLIKSIKSNNLNNVILVKCAVGEVEGKVSFTNHTYNNSGDAHVSFEGDIDTFEVDMFTLDYLTPLNVNFIKIDVEGAELLVMRGATRILENKPVILSEIYPKNLQAISKVTAKEYIDYMAQKQYDCYVLTAWGTLGRRLLDYKGTVPINVIFWPKEREGE